MNTKLGKKGDQLDEDNNTQYHDIKTRDEEKEQFYVIKDDEKANYICFLNVLSGTATGSETKNVNYVCDLYYKKICTNNGPQEECDQKLVTCPTT